MFDHLVSTYDDMIGCCWTAFEPSRDDAHTSCIDGGFLESPVCDCDAEEQTMRHIVDDCPLRLFADGLTYLIVKLLLKFCQIIADFFGI
jgi:hypothetical protein